MQLDPYAEGLVLVCSCGEKMVIFGRVEDWLPRNPIFRCNCGEKLILSEDAKEEYYASSGRRNTVRRFEENPEPLETAAGVVVTSTPEGISPLLRSMLRILGPHRSRRCVAWAKT